MFEKLIAAVFAFGAVYFIALPLVLFMVTEIAPEIFIAFSRKNILSRFSSPIRNKRYGKGPSWWQWSIQWPYLFFFCVSENTRAILRLRRIRRAQRDEKYRHYLALEDAKKAEKEQRFLEKRARQLRLQLEENEKLQVKTKARIATPTYRIAEPDTQSDADLPEEVAEKLRRANS